MAEQDPIVPTDVTGTKSKNAKKKAPHSLRGTRTRRFRASKSDGEDSSTEDSFNGAGALEVVQELEAKKLAVVKELEAKKLEAVKELEAKVEHLIQNSQAQRLDDEARIQEMSVEDFKKFSVCFHKKQLDHLIKQGEASIEVIEMNGYVFTELNNIKSDYRSCIDRVKSLREKLQ